MLTLVIKRVCFVKFHMINFLYIKTLLKINLAMTTNKGKVLIINNNHEVYNNLLRQLQFKCPLPIKSNPQEAFLGYLILLLT